MYKGQLEGFPTEVVEKMLYHQVEQGYKRDVTVFEKNKASPSNAYGFDWDKSHERYDFWVDVIINLNFDIFFERYPKHITTNTMNVKQIIKDNDIKEVYSIYHGYFVDCLFAIHNFNDDGSLVEGGECLIFPSKEERTWDRFKPKEQTYKPYESVEQFADLFLGAKVKLKEGIGFKIVDIIEEEDDLNYLFNNYTLLDGTPLGIKCE